MSTSRPVIRVTAVVIRDGDEVLLVRKRGTSAFMFPGGKPESGEDALTCGVREVSEELGLVLAPADLLALGRWETEAANEPGHSLVADVLELVGPVGEQAPGPGGLAAAQRGGSRDGIAAAAEIEELRWQPISERDAPDLAPLTRQVLGRLLVAQSR